MSSALIAPLQAQAVALQLHLYHEPIITASANEDIVIHLRTEAGIGEISEAQALWRNAGGDFRTCEMTPDEQGLTYTIPAEFVKPPYLEYAILVRFSGNELVSYPLMDPLINPQVIAIRQETTQQQKSTAKFVVLYPQEGNLIFSPEVTIAVSIFDPDSTFDPNSIEIIRDGFKVRPDQATRTFLLIKLTELKSGRHVIVLRSKDFQGQQNPDYHWSFSTAVTGEKRPLATFSWAFTGEGIMEDFSGEKEGILRSDLRAQGEFKRIGYNARVYKTSEEAWDRQPQDRFLFGLQHKYFYLNLGDANPVYSDLVLSGRRVRGIDLGGKLGGFHLSGTYGEIIKPIEGQTYRRNLIGIRPFLTTSSGGKFGLSFLKIKDDIASMSDTTIAPKDNLVVGLDALQPLFSRRLELAASMAFSLTALDITGGTISQAAIDSLEEKGGFNIPFDPQPWEPLIVINESLTPPNPLTMSSLAWMGSASFREFGQLLTFRYRHVGPSYYSLGNPYLQNDLAGWSLTDQFSLWRRRLFFSVGLDKQEDNLRDTKPATTTLSGGWLTVAVYPSAPAPILSFSLNYHTNSNNISQVETINDSLYLDQRRDDQSLALSSSLQQKLYFWDRRHTLTLSVNRSNYSDVIDDRPPEYADLNSVNTNAGVIWRTEFSKTYSGTGSYSYYSSESGVSDFKYQQLGAEVSSKFPKQKLQITLGASRREGEAQFARWQSFIRADWEFYPKHSVRVDANRYFNDASMDEGIYRIYYYKRFN